MCSTIIFGIRGSHQSVWTLTGDVLGKKKPTNKIKLQFLAKQT